MDGDLLEYSVIYTDRAKNLMAASFSECFKDITRELCECYKTDHCVLIPGSGHNAMESIAGQFPRFKSDANYTPCMVIRNGFFSFRWSDIWASVYPEACGRSPELKVLKARPVAEGPKSAFAPMPLEEVVAQIEEHKPCVVFLPHVETSAGMLVSDEYIKGVSDAVHKNPDAIFVLDGIAAGNKWVNMEALGVDIYVTAPQKGWTSPASVGIAMMNQRAKDLMQALNAAGRVSHSFCCNLAKWSGVSDAYQKENGFMYYTTLPTDALMAFRDNIMETKAFGYEKCEAAMGELGAAVRGLLEAKGFASVAAEGFQAPTVVVSYMRDESDRDIVARFKAQGMQLATGVPLKIDEEWEGPPPTFRVGLFGLDKMKDPAKTAAVFAEALDAACP